MIRLRAKLTDAAASVKGIFGVKSEKDTAVQKLEALKVRLSKTLFCVCQLSFLAQISACLLCGLAPFCMFRDTLAPSDWAQI